MECRCSGGLCREQPVVLNPRFVLVCCPKWQAGHGGCGFMQWQDTKEPDNTVTWNHHHHHSRPRAATSQDPLCPPPSWPELVCPCSAGASACSVALAKNGRNFYFCSACKFRRWCDERSSSACFLCRKEGHWSKDCPQLPPSAAAAAASNKTICFNCKREGHYAAQCPSKRRRRD